MVSTGKSEKNLVLQGTGLRVAPSTDVSQSEYLLRGTVTVKAQGMNYNGEIMWGDKQALDEMHNVVATTIRDDDFAKMGLPETFATEDGMGRVCATLAEAAAEAVAAGHNPRVVDDALYALRGSDCHTSPVADRAVERNVIVDTFKKALRALLP